MHSIPDNDESSSSSDPNVVPGYAAQRRPSARHALLFGLKEHRGKVWWLVAAVVLGALALVGVWRFTDLTVAEVTNWIDGLSLFAMLPAMALLPIAGFPIAVVYLVAGARFGPIGGGAVVAAVTAVHLLGSYAIARSFLRVPLQRFIERRHAHLPHIPEEEQAAVCLIAALIPGLPYVVRNYLLALAGVRLRYYFWVCLPIYVARSYVTILLGDISSDPSRTKIIVLIGIDILKVGICAFVIWRLREHHRKFHGHEHPADDASAIEPPSAAAK